MKKLGVLIAFTFTLLFSSQAAKAAELVTNGGFETGNFTGWTATNPSGGFENWAVTGSGFGFTDIPVPIATQVIDGNFNAWQSVAASAGQSYLLTQDVAIPAGQIAILRWKDRFQMNLTTYCGSGGQPACGTATYGVEILNTSNVLLQTLYTVITSAEQNTNTGWVNHQVNVSAFNGQTIRLRFRTTVTTTLAGPGRLEVDAVSITAFLTTSADLVVGGQALAPNGMGIGGATITLIDGAGNPRTTTTGPLGYYQFDEVEAGNYVVTATAKGKVFVDSPVVITVNDNMLNVNFHSAM